MGMTGRAWLVLLAALGFAVSPFLNPEFGGFDPERYPIPQREPPVQPAGYAFAIWGVIYLWLLVHAMLGVLRHGGVAAWDACRLPLLISLGVGAFWLPVALVSPIWATVMIWVMLLAALMALSAARGAEPAWAAPWPIGLYAGWLSAAAFVSLGLLGAGYGWASESQMAFAMVIFAAGFACAIQLRLGRIWSYGFAACWGLIAIAVRNWAESWSLTALALVLAVVLLLQTGRQALR